MVYPSNAADAKALLKSAIRTNNPVLFVESQSLYSAKGRRRRARTTSSRSASRRSSARAPTSRSSRGARPSRDAIAAADRLQAEDGIAAEVIDLRSLVPVDMETVLASVRKTGRCVVASQAILGGSFVNEVAARIQQDVFDYLDAPVARIGAANGISPQAEILERAFLPNAADIYDAAKGLL